MKNKSIILIGMPGAGKSTIGVLLAKEMAKAFVDTDILLQEQLGSSLQAFLDAYGYLALRKREEQILLNNNFDHHIVATGGSVVYSDLGMKALAKHGLILYLKISEETLLKRVDNHDTRGIASAPSTTLRQVYQERLPLYKYYAQWVVECDEKTPAAIVKEIFVKAV